LNRRGNLPFLYVRRDFMKPVFLHFTDGEGNTTKTFTTCSLKTGMIDNILDLAEKASELEKGNNIVLTDVRAFYSDLKAIIIAVFKHQFTFEELNENVEQEELMRVIKDISSKIAGEMRKK